MVQAVDFVKAGMEVQVRYDDNNKPVWYRGVVQSVVTPVTLDADGNVFVEANVVYNDATDQTVETFFEKDFDNLNSNDGWTLAFRPAVPIVKEMVNANKQYNDLVFQVDKLEQLVKLNKNKKTQAWWFKTHIVLIMLVPIILGGFYANNLFVLPSSPLDWMSPFLSSSKNEIKKVLSSVVVIANNWCNMLLYRLSSK